MCGCGDTADTRCSVFVLCVLAVYAVSPGCYSYINRDYSHQKMLMGVHIMKVVVMKSPKALAWIFRIIFGIKAKRA